MVALAPAVALRGSYVRLSGDGDLRAETKSADVSVSKGFLFFTPHAGIGYAWGRVTPDAGFGLNREMVEELRVFAGARLSLGLFEITPEYEHLGDSDIYSLRLSAGF